MTSGNGARAAVFFAALVFTISQWCMNTADNATPSVSGAIGWLNGDQRKLKNSILYSGNRRALTCRAFFRSSLPSEEERTSPWQSAW